MEGEGGRKGNGTDTGSWWVPRRDGSGWGTDGGRGEWYVGT